jgi:hypothetical protein
MQGEKAGTEAELNSNKIEFVGYVIFKHGSIRLLRDLAA